jgi:hypothetical protein
MPKNTGYVLLSFFQYTFSIYVQLSLFILLFMQKYATRSGLIGHQQVYKVCLIR